MFIVFQIQSKYVDDNYDDHDDVMITGDPEIVAKR